jgi:hypothetical protein
MSARLGGSSLGRLVAVAHQIHEHCAGERAGSEEAERHESSATRPSVRAVSPVSH